MGIIRPEGTFDILPDEAKVWNKFQNNASTIFAKYGYTEIFTPIIERTELFVRGIGDQTDVVSKEMYNCISGGNLAKLLAGQNLKSKSKLSLRPEGTAGTVRAIIQNALVQQGAAPAKLMYAGPMFRAERPAAGRQRQFMQIGVECVGASAPSVDAEAIIMLVEFYKSLGFDCVANLDTQTDKRAISLIINSMGCSKCRAKYREDLLEFLEGIKGELCDTCKERIVKNPLRVLDCKIESCQNALQDAPAITDYLCDECKDHYAAVKQMLSANGIEYTQDDKLVRGLDYYTKTVFELRCNKVGAQDALAGGGRYDGLVQELGGSPTPGFGFALGYERTLLAMKNSGYEFEPAKTCDYFVACVDDTCAQTTFDVVMKLRSLGKKAEIDHQGRSLKSQFKLADKLNAKFTVIVGPDELAQGKVTFRNMDTKQQDLVSLQDIENYVN